MSKNEETLAVMRPKELKDALVWAIKHNHPILIKGMPGVGKTEIGKQANDLLQYKILVAHPVVDNPTDYKGFGFVIDGKAEFIPFGNLRRLLETDEPLTFFIDDVGQAPPAVQSALMQLLLERSINGKKISDHVRFIAATNRREDKANVSGILEPVKSRFDSIIQLESHPDDWLEWAVKNPQIHHEMISYIRTNPDMLNKWEPTRDIQNCPIPRTVAKAARMLTNGVPSHLRPKLIAGACGEGFALSFEEFREVYMELPTFAEIIANPNSAKLPDKISARFAITGMITANTDAQNFGDAVRYLKRMEEELMIATVMNTFKRNPSVTSNRDFGRWAAEYGQMLTEV